MSGFPNKGRSWVSLNSSWKPPSQPAGVAAGGGSRETDTSTWNKTGGSTQRHAPEYKYIRKYKNTGGTTLVHNDQQMLENEHKPSPFKFLAWN